MIAGWEIIAGVVALAVAIAALVPFVPPWAWYAFTVAFWFTRVADVLEHGLSAKRLLVVATSSIVVVGGSSCCAVSANAEVPHETSNRSATDRVWRVAASIGHAHGVEQRW